MGFGRTYGLRTIHRRHTHVDGSLWSQLHFSGIRAGTVKGDCRKMTDVIVIGAGPAGLVAALRAGDLGARTTLMTSGEFGGMASNDGPVPVRTLAHAARLIREARQLGQYGISSAPPTLDYPRLLERVREVVEDVRSHPAFRSQLETAGVAIHER